MCDGIANRGHKSIHMPLNFGYSRHKVWSALCIVLCWFWWIKVNVDTCTCIFVYAFRRRKGMLGDQLQFMPSFLSNFTEIKPNLWQSQFSFFFFGLSRKCQKMFLSDNPCINLSESDKTLATKGSLSAF